MVVPELDATILPLEVPLAPPKVFPEYFPFEVEVFPEFLDIVGIDYSPFEIV